MKVSLDWLREYVAVPQLEALTERLTNSAIEVDGVVNQGDALEYVVVGFVRSVQQHPNADKLKICTVDVGEKHPRTIVCGAPNVAEGLTVLAALPGAKVVSKKGGEMIIAEAELRGVMSYGMLCGAEELGIGGDTGGLYTFSRHVKPGTPAAKALGKSDVVLDLDVLAHRGDCMSHVGIAREISALFGVKNTYVPPKLPKVKNQKVVKITVDEEIGQRFTAMVVSGVGMGESAPQIAARIQAIGEQPINALVDATNYVMHGMGQPLHAFDLDRIAGHTMHVTLSRKGEQLTVIGGQSVTLDQGAVIIRDEHACIDLAGIKGGVESSVQPTTTSVVVIAPVFDAKRVRTTSRATGIRTEAVGRFEKGVNPEATEEALATCYNILKERFPEAKVTQVFDWYPKKVKAVRIGFAPERVEHLVGIRIPANKMKSYLQDLGCSISVSGKRWNVQPPYYRRDLNTEEDIVEEVVRLHGYHLIPDTTPIAPIQFGQLSLELRVQRSIREFLSRRGAHEIISYTFESQHDLDRMGLATDDHIAIQNPISDDYVYLRTQLISGALKAYGRNANAGRDVALFEYGRVMFPPLEKVKEAPELMIAYSGEDGLRRVKGMAEELLEHLQVAHVEYTELGVPAPAACSYWNAYAPGSGTLLKVGETIIGVIASISPKVAKSFGVKYAVAVAVLYPEKLAELASTSQSFQPIPMYPAIEVDITVSVPQAVTWKSVKDTVVAVDSLIASVQFISTYTGTSVQSGYKNLTLRCTLQSTEKTLESAEAEAVTGRIREALNSLLEANIRS